MRPEDVRDYVTRQPFQPFRVTLTDGRTYDVGHPNFAMVGRSSVAIGLPMASDRFYDRLITVPLIHIMQIEPIPSERPSNGVAG